MAKCTVTSCKLSALSKGLNAVDWSLCRFNSEKKVFSLGIKGNEGWDLSEQSCFHDLNRFCPPFLNMTAIFHIPPIKSTWVDEVSGGSGISLLEILFKTPYQNYALESLPQFSVIMLESSMVKITWIAPRKCVGYQASPGSCQDNSQEAVFFPMPPDRKEIFPWSFLKTLEDVSYSRVIAIVIRC